MQAAVHAAPSPSLRYLLAIVGDGARVVTGADKSGASSLGIRAVKAANDPALLVRAADLGRRGPYTPRVDHVFPLASIVRAHELAAGGSGKVVVTVP